MSSDALCVLDVGRGDRSGSFQRSPSPLPLPSLLLEPKHVVENSIRWIPWPMVPSPFPYFYCPKRNIALNMRKTTHRPIMGCKYLKKVKKVIATLDHAHCPIRNRPTKPITGYSNAFFIMCFLLIRCNDSLFELTHPMTKNTRNNIVCCCFGSRTPSSPIPILAYASINLWPR